MEPVRLYGLKNCSTCVKAMKWLQEQDVPYAFTDYRDEPVAPDTLRTWADQLGGWEKLVNRASMTWRRLPDESRAPATPEAWLALVQAHPALVRRPVMVTADGQASVGYSEKKYRELFA
ncbi:Spx/MgsR family RNA polymerase-binding regulatory protein [Parapusillimonas sp. SGNA-6]|nr:Spx/MgsR family RNA polymerase-binding regulatory protein [Parapusillimonas sp. SGNA-6]